jgi:two-component system OmpR family sensor kinase
VKRTAVRVILAFLPLIAGLGAFLVFRLAFPDLPLLFFRADVGSALLVATGLVSLVILAWVVRGEVERRASNFRLEEERVQQKITSRRFIRRLDHELKNPLTGLRAALVNLSQGYEIDSTAAGEKNQPQPAVLAEVHRTVVDAQAQVERLSRLVADLRKLAELEERPLDTSRVNLAEMLEATVEAVVSLPACAGREIRMALPRVPWPLPPITGDRDLLELAFYNLVENACKFSGPGAAVEVRAVEDGRWIHVEVADNGPGIGEEDLPR